LISNIAMGSAIIARLSWRARNKPLSYQAWILSFRTSRSMNLKSFR
jgi:hypothetical protein